MEPTTQKKKQDGVARHRISWSALTERSAIPLHVTGRDCPLLCRFLDAGGTEALHKRGGPASKKRQGAKSRGAGQRLDGERYGDFRLAAHSMGRDIAATRPAWLSRGGGREGERSVPG